MRRASPRRKGTAFRTGRDAAASPGLVLLPGGYRLCMTTAQEDPAPLVAGHPERVSASTTGAKSKKPLVVAVLVGLLLTVGAVRALRRR